ncbi:MAG: hypothetical protein GX623_06665 [Clostridiales bacterium]|nr:hypothetical protein [Clostridiales bacterium]
MERIKEFDEVLLADGREGAVVEVMGDQVWFMVDVGSSPADWETIDVDRGQIVKVIRHAD